MMTAFAENAIAAITTIKAPPKRVEGTGRGEPMIRGAAVKPGTDPSFPDIGITRTETGVCPRFYGCTRTWYVTLPLPPESSDPPRVQTIEPVPLTAGCVVTVQLEMLPGSGA